jgi:hypothetical protein
MSFLTPITRQTEFATTPQNEAIENISASSVMNVTPEIFKENRAEWLPEIEHLKKPVYASNTVAKVMQRGPQEASAIAPDVKDLSLVDKMIGDAGNKINNVLGKPRQMTDLYFKKMTLGLDENEEFTLAGLQEGSKNNFGQVDYGLDFAESLVGSFAAGLVDFGGIAFRNKAIIGSLTAGGAALGATTTMVGGPVTGTAGAVAGGIAGFATGFGVAGFYDSYKQMAGASYGEFEDIIDKETGLPMDETTKKALAHGVGLVGGAIEFVADRALLKNLPFLKKYLSPKSMKAELAANPGLRQAIINISKSMATEGTAEALQEITSILGEEIGSTYSKGETSFVEGLTRAGDKIANDPKVQKRVAESLIVGGLVGGAVHTGMATISKGIKYVAKKNPSAEVPAAPPAVEGKIDVNPQGQEAISVEVPKTEMIPAVPDPALASKQILEFQNVVNEAGVKVKGTGLYKQSPEMLSQLRKQMVENAGATEVWFDEDEIQEKFGSDEKAMDKIRNAFDPSGAAATNARRSMPMHKFMDLVDSGIAIDEYARLHPEGPNPKSAEQYAKNKKAADEKRKAFSERLGAVGEKTPEQRAAEIPMNIDPETFDVGQFGIALGSKEVADAYIQRLDGIAEKWKAENETFVEEAKELKAIELMRRKVELIKETLPDDDSYKGVLQQAIDTTFPENNIYTEFDYMNQPVLTKAIEGVVGEKEVAEINAAVKDSKQQIVDNIDEAAKYEMDKIIDTTVEEAMHAEILLQIEKLERSRELQITERFETMVNDKGGEQYQINPKLLTEQQRDRFANNKEAQRLFRKRKVFSKDGGMTADSLAAMLGAKSADELLTIFANVPTRVEIAEARAEYNREETELEAKQSVDLNHTAIEKAYHNKTYNDLRVAELMREIYWKTTKKIHKLFALPLKKRVQEIIDRANRTVDQMRVRDLKPNRFKVGQRKSHQIAVVTSLDGDYETAAIAKEAEALNTELTLATMKAIKEVNLLKRLVKKMKKGSTRDLLKKMGAWKAVEEVFDLWNLVGAAKNQSERDAYAKHAAEQLAAGNGTIEIPDRLSDLRESLNDMRVEQVKVVRERLQLILHLAKLKNELNEKHGPAAQAQKTLDQAANEFAEFAPTHPDYDAKKDIKPQGKMPTRNKLIRLFSRGLSPIKNVEHIVLRIDLHKVLGFMNRLLVEPAKGRGEFKTQGESYKDHLRSQFVTQMTKIIEKFGATEWAKLKNTTVYVPEFKDSTHLSNGHLTKWNLFQLLLNMGNESNQQRLVTGYVELDANNKPTTSISRETIATILERHLDLKHYVAAQNMWNMYKSLREPVRQLQLRTKGVEPTFIEGKAFQAHGQVFEGGYYPIIHEAEMNIDKIRKVTNRIIDVSSGESLAHLKNLHFAEDMTKQGYLEARTSSTLPVNINHSLGVPFETVIHDIAFREVVRDGLAILTHDKFSKEITRIIGPNDFNVLINSYVQLAASTDAENSLLWDSSDLYKKMEAKARSSAQIAVLAFRLKTMIIQLLSPINSIQLMGFKNGLYYTSKTFAEMLKLSLDKMGKPELSKEYLASVFKELRTNPFNLNNYYDFAAEINPKIRNIMQGIDDNIRDPIKKLEPKESLTQIPGAKQITDATEKFSEVSTDMAMGILGQIDLSMKVAFTIASYQQFMNGDAPGFSLEKLDKMTEEERHNAASSYASSIVDLTLTAGSPLDKAPIQKEWKMMAVFFNDARNHLNNQMRIGREVRWALKDGNFADAATSMAMLMLMTGLYRSIEDIIRGNETPWSGRGDKGYTSDRFSLRKMMKDPLAFVKNMGLYFSSAPVDQFLGNIPLLRDAKYILDHDSVDPRKRKQGMEPFPLKIANDLLVHTPRAVEKLTLSALDYMKIKRANRSRTKLSKREKQALAFTILLPTSKGAGVNALIDLFDTTPKTTRSIVKSLGEIYRDTFREFEKEEPDDEAINDLREIDNLHKSDEEPEESSELDKTEEETKD